MTILDQLEQAEKAATHHARRIFEEAEARGYVVPGTFHDDALGALLRNHAADLIAVARAADRMNDVLSIRARLIADDDWQSRVEMLRDTLAPLLANEGETA